MGRRAFGLAYRLLGDSGAAEDAVQDGFVSLWQRADRIDPQRGNVESLLMTIVYRRSIDLLRTRRGQRALDVPLDPETIEIAADEVVDEIYDTLTVESAQRAVEALAPEQRRVVESAYFGGMTQVEIAAAEGLPLGTVKSRLRLALAHLREAMGVPTR